MTDRIRIQNTNLKLISRLDEFKKNRRMRRKEQRRKRRLQMRKKQQLETAMANKESKNNSEQ